MLLITSQVMPMVNFTAVAFIQGKNLQDTYLVLLTN